MINFKEFYNLQIKPLIRPFVILFIIFFFIFNWNNVVWIFNQRALEENLNQLLAKDIGGVQLTFDQAMQGGTVNTSTQAAKAYSFENATLKIPKINFEYEITFPGNLEEETVSKALMAKVMHYPTATYPGEKGDVVLLAHSAPNSWPPNYRVFNQIDKLEEGDILIIHFNNQDFSYKVVKSFLITPGEPIPPSDRGDHLVHLLTCWPVNTGNKRMVVEAVLMQ